MNFIKQKFVIFLLGALAIQSSASAKNLFNTFSIGASSNRYSWSSTQNESSLNLDLLTSYQYSSNLSLGHDLSIFKDLKNSEGWDLDDGYFSGTYRFDESWQFVDISWLTRIYYPSSEVSRNEKSMRTKIFLAPVFSFSFDQLDWDFLNVMLRPGYTHGFYKYNSATTGVSNVRSSLSQLLAIGLAFNSWSQFVSTFNYVWSWDHYGNKRSDQFTWAQDVIFKLNSFLDLDLGYQNQGQALGPLGNEWRVSAFDDQTGVFSLTLSVNF